MALVEVHSLLGALHLAPPAIGPRSGEQRATPPSEIHRRIGDALPMPVPLFAYDLPWHKLPTELCAEVSRNLTEALVITGLLDLDVGGDRPRSRVMCPYRPDRFGVQQIDVSGAMIVDMRLTTQVGWASAYTMEQLCRWDQRAASLPEETVITAMRWPADVASADSLNLKVDQLRTLAPDAAIFGSISPYHLDGDIPPMIAAGLDGLILRFDVDPLSPSAGRIVASLTATARRHLDTSGNSGMGLWVVVPTRSPLDVVKLLALGATAVSVDHLVADHWPDLHKESDREEEPAAEPEPRGTFSLGLPPAPAKPIAEPEPSALHENIEHSIRQMLSEALTFVHGLGVAHYTQLNPTLLATLDRDLAKMTGARFVGE